MRDHLHLPQEALATFLELTRLINYSLDLEEVLVKATSAAERILNVEACTIYVLDEMSQEIHFRVLRGRRTGPLKTMTLKMGEGVAGWVISEGKPVILDDAASDPRFASHFDKESGFETRAMVAVPLTYKDKTVGAIQILNPKSGGSFHDEDLTLLQSLGNIVAAALENARLYEITRSRYEMTSEELREVQARLIRTERLAGLYHLMSGVAHEVRNPVVSIGGFAARMQKKLPKDHEFQKYLDIILESVDRLQRLVDDVKEFCSLGRTAPVLVAPDDFLDEFLVRWEGRMADAKVELARDYNGPLPRIRIDRDMVRVALDKVITNSLEAMSGPGEIALKVRAEGDYLVIRITDTGKGIASDDLPHVFDPFFTSKTQGVGLGLATVHHVMKEHQGEVKIVSEHGRSTTVILSFPLGEGAGPAAGGEAPSEKSSRPPTA